MIWWVKFLENYWMLGINNISMCSLVVNDEVQISNYFQLPMIVRDPPRLKRRTMSFYGCPGNCVQSAQAGWRCGAYKGGGGWYARACACLGCTCNSWYSVIVPGFKYWSNSAPSGGPSGRRAGEISGMPAKSIESLSGEGSRLSLVLVEDGGGLRRRGWYL